VKAAVVVFPGSNRERDAGRALRLASGREPAYVWHGERALPTGTDLVLLPGGFSYGDYLRCGAIAAQSPIMAAVRRHAAAGGYVLGICNGFQIACEAGLLPGFLMRNAGLKFLCRKQHLRIERTDTAFASGYRVGQVIAVGIAHGEGNYMAEADILRRLEGEGQVAFRYCDAEGRVGGAANPNGSMNDIAGVYSANRRVLGLMPHPENHVEAAFGGTDGLAMFESLAQAASGSVAGAAC
jgi:phosphoribosylformylglycinamidine synthase